MTLACGDDNSKFVEVVTVANVDDMDRVGNSLLKIWSLRFGHKTKLFYQTLSTRFNQDFEVFFLCVATPGRVQGYVFIGLKSIY